MLDLQVSTEVLQVRRFHITLWKQLFCFLWVKRHKARGPDDAHTHPFKWNRWKERLVAHDPSHDGKSQITCHCAVGLRAAKISYSDRRSSRPILKAVGVEASRVAIDLRKPEWDCPDLPPTFTAVPSGLTAFSFRARLVAAHTNHQSAPLIWNNATAS